MTKKPVTHVILVHGYGGHGENLWFPWLHREIEKYGVAVTSPSLPSPLRPDYKAWYATLKPHAERWDENTLVIAHSLGGPTALRLLELQTKKKVRAVILVSPLFASALSVKPLLEFFARAIDWKKLRARAGSYTVIQAKDDPLVPYDHAYRYHELLGADLHIANKGGHFTAKKFPLLLKLVKKHLV